MFLRHFVLFLRKLLCESDRDLRQRSRVVYLDCVGVVRVGLDIVTLDVSVSGVVTRSALHNTATQ